MLQQAILLAYAVVVLGVRPAGAPWLLLVAVPVWGAVLLALGTAIATLVRSHGELSAICDLGALIISSLGGAFVPVEMFPPWLRAVAPISPGYWGLSMLQAALRGDVRTTWTAAAVLSVIAAAAGVLACRRMSRGWGRTTML